MKERLETKNDFRLGPSLGKEPLNYTISNAASVSSNGILLFVFVLVAAKTKRFSLAELNVLTSKSMVHCSV